MGWAVGDGLVRGARVRPARASGVPVMGRRRVELELRDGLGSREIEGRGLIEMILISPWQAGQRRGSTSRPTLRVGARGPEAGPRACGWVVMEAWLPACCSVP